MRVFIAILGTLAAVPAGAADDVMANYYGNTVVTKSDLGESHLHYRSDHKFDGTGSNAMGSMQLSGTWSIDAKGQLCRTYEVPPPGAANPDCIPIAPHKPGDSWSMTANGVTRAVTLVAGLK